MDEVHLRRTFYWWGRFVWSVVELAGRGLMVMSEKDAAEDVARHRPTVLAAAQYRPMHDDWTYWSVRTGWEGFAMQAQESCPSTFDYLESIKLDW